MSIFSNPVFLAALQAQGNPMGKAMMEQSLAERDNQLKKAQIDKFRMEQEDALRQREAEERLPEALKGIDFGNPQAAMQQLVSKGLSVQQALAIVDKVAGIGNDQRRLGFEEQRVGFDRERLGLDRARLGIEQGNLNLKARELQKKLENGGLSPEEKAKLESELRKELDQTPIHKDFTKVKTTFNQIKSLTEKANPSGFDDNSAIVLYVKMNDPTSVVSPGEFVTAQNAPGLPAQLLGKIQSWQRKGSLDPQSRRELKNAAQTAYKEQARSYKDYSGKYKALATKSNLDPSNVVLFEPDEKDFAPEPVELKQPSVGNNTSREQQIINQLKAEGFTDEQISKIR